MLYALFTHTSYHVKHWTFNHPPLENFLKTFQGSVIQFPHTLPRDVHLHGYDFPLLIVYESSCQYLLLLNALEFTNAGICSLPLGNQFIPLFIRLSDEFVESCYLIRDIDGATAADAVLRVVQGSYAADVSLKL